MSKSIINELGDVLRKLDKTKQKKVLDFARSLLPKKLARPAAKEVETKRRPRDAEKYEMKKPAEKKINLNTATRSELITLPGVGPAVADRILAYRKKYWRFDELSELLENDGIDEDKFDRIKSKVRID